MSALTRDQLITLALKQAGNEDVTTEAQDWLNNILDFLARLYDWPFFFKEGTGTTSSDDEELTLPADFLRLWGDRGLTFDLSGTKTVASHVSIERFNDYAVRESSSGRPDFYFVDHNAQKIKFAPAADDAYSWVLFYRFKPARLSGNTAPDFPDDLILVQGIYVFALQFEDDQRHDKELEIWLRSVDGYAASFGLVPDEARRRNLLEQVKAVKRG